MSNRVRGYAARAADADLAPLDFERRERRPDEVASALLIGGRKSILGSMIGGIAETQEMLDFCAAHDISCDVEMIAIQDINRAYERLVRSDVRYRFVIDLASMKSPGGQ